MSSDKITKVVPEIMTSINALSKYAMVFQPEIISISCLLSESVRFAKESVKINVFKVVKHLSMVIKKKCFIMSDNNTPKVFKKGYGSNFVIPFAIVLIGSLIIFGVTKMLTTDRGYKDLVRELHSKTFGNRWIAAFELSKVISANGVPEDEVPWLVENLEDLI